MLRQLPRLIVILATSAALTHCGPNGLHVSRDATRLKSASAKSLTAEQRAVSYLQAAEQAAKTMASDDKARLVYNRAAADLTVLLRTQPDSWNHPQVLTANGSRYHLHFAKATRNGGLDPAYFTSLVAAADVERGTIKRANVRDGLGGCLVGVHRGTPPEPFAPQLGVTAPVTTMLDFHGSEVTLTLLDPTVETTARHAGKTYPLAADFSASLAYYPQKSELWEGLMGAVRVSKHMGTTGLYQLQPYDPDRIPLIFVHGLISTPRMWRNVINELQMDPELRRKYQCWVFSYPTGNPPGYSALRFREELEKFRRIHPDARNYVLVGHSMGGLVSRMQVTNIDRQAWDVMGKDKAKLFFANVKPGSLVDRATVFQANPKIGRVIFICTPHRGSEMAIGSLGELAMRVITLPVDLASIATSSLGNSVAIITGDPNRMPNSITGLSPRNPALRVMDSKPIVVPHHTILGDRGKGNSPSSSDGVVEYWSSHLKTAHSEHIVPGPHGACEMPATLAELNRLLHLHLKSL